MMMLCSKCRLKLRRWQTFGAFATNDGGVSRTRLRRTRLATTTAELRSLLAGLMFGRVRGGELNLLFAVLVSG